jgi:hypothetical protein
VKSVLLVAVAALSIFAVAACGSSSPAPTTTGTPTAAPVVPTTTPTAPGGTTSPAPTPALDVCALLTPADLKAVTGGNYTEAGVSASVDGCTWLGGGAGVTSGHAFVGATIGDNPLAAIKRTFPGGVDLTVSGYAAYWASLTGFHAISVDVDGRTLVLAIDPAGADGQTIAQKLAEIAVANM